MSENCALFPSNRKKTVVQTANALRHCESEKKNASFMPVWTPSIGLVNIKKVSTVAYHKWYPTIWSALLFGLRFLLSPLLSVRIAPASPWGYRWLEHHPLLLYRYDRLAGSCKNETKPQYQQPRWDVPSASTDTYLLNSSIQPYGRRISGLKNIDAREMGSNRSEKQKTCQI